jgi:starch synthase
LNILMLSSENDALPKGKVGGIGDVIRDVPKALANLGHKVDVLTPGYQWFSTLHGASKLQTIIVPFAGINYDVDLYEVPAPFAVDGVRHLVLEHPIFAVGGAGAIYCNDPPDRPFANDATKFALFSIAAAELIKQQVLTSIDVVHLHDWHAANFATLRALHKDYVCLQALPTVYTVHNLALQGIRPLHGNSSSLEAWYGNNIAIDDRIIDPRYGDCYNPMHAAINLSDKVHVVSPTYAKEVMQSSNHDIGFFGGEGLEGDMQQADQQGRLLGILNGVDYPEHQRSPMDRGELFDVLLDDMCRIAGSDPAKQALHKLAIDRLTSIKKSGLHRKLLLTSVGRISDQKMLIMRQQTSNGEFVIDEFLSTLGDQGCFVLVGNGDPMLQQFLHTAAKRHENFVFLEGFFAELGQLLYENGDIFIMPSSFEPCGISQMIAMRHGQPCLVHAVGGLADTVEHQHNGISFSGHNSVEQGEAMVAALHLTLNMSAKEWQTLRTNAAATRFTWNGVVKRYVNELYA